MKIIKHLTFIFLLPLVTLLSCSDSEDIGGVKDHRYDPQLTVNGNTTTDAITEIPIGNPATLSINLNNASSDAFTILPSISGNAIVSYENKELKNNTPLVVELQKNGILQFSLSPSSSGDIEISFSIDNKKMVKVVKHIFRVSKTEIVFGADNVDIKSYVNNKSSFTISMKAPENGIAYDLMVEKLRGTGMLSTSTQKDISNQKSIEIPSSYEIAFNYQSNEVGAHQLRFTLSDNKGSTKSLDINIEVVNSDYYFAITVPQPILKPNTTYPVIIKANKSGYAQPNFTVKYNLKEGKGEFKQSDRTISEGSTFSLLKDIETPYSFTPSQAGSYTITFVTTIENINYENSLEFEVKKYNLSVISNNPTWGTVTGGGSYLYDDEVEIISTPSNHYAYVGLYDGDTEITNLPTYKIKINNDYNLTAKFNQIGYNIIALSSQGGKATADKETYTINEIATLTATAEDKYIFSHWQHNGAEFSRANPLVLEVTKSDTYEAVFTNQRHKVEVHSTGNGQATIIDNSTGYVDHNSSVTLKAIPSVGYTSIGWWENNIQLTDKAELEVKKITSNRVFTAKFSVSSYLFSCTASVGGSVNPTELDESYLHGTPKTLGATANISHTFSHWTLNGTHYSTLPTIHVNITENSDYVAIFTIRKFDITFGNYGSTRSFPSADPVVVDYNGSTTLIPNTHEDDYLLGWKLSGSSSFIGSNIINNITANTHVIAHYRNNNITVTHKRESAYNIYVGFSEPISYDINVTISFEDLINGGYVTETARITNGSLGSQIRISDRHSNIDHYQLTISKLSSSDTYKYTLN